MTPVQGAYTWLQNIIDSANNTFHFDAVDALIKLFHQKFNDQKLTDCLTEQRQINFNNIHTILN